ncbi:hypothetical protein, conserved [Plasmodium gonderi]|uniref:Protein kinase domain-containing protein n=1 Tax=Plasmodium gonderi TaxID=77519 RepID=A0A1Y1JEC4_PLAGO|nr:hypothetical protein, conserved [Plasmodium gonderi]GAW79675.1 hypothetical protein, conserved [Plasmodium gonderi]
MGNTLYSNVGCSSTQLDEIYCKHLNNLYNIYSYLFKYEQFIFMNCYTLNSFCHVLEGINKNEGHVLIKICKLKGETQKIKRILYTLKFLFSFDLFPNVLPYNRMSVYENNIYIYRKFIYKNLDHYLLNEKNNKSFCYFVLFQIFLSMIQLHSLGIYHGHIKTENFLIQNNMNIFITDINILNNYLYFIPSVRCEDKRRDIAQRLLKLQGDIFNLGILILEILLNDKSVSYLFLKENYSDNNKGNYFYSGRRKEEMFHLMENKEKKKKKKKHQIKVSKKNKRNVKTNKKKKKKIPIDNIINISEKKNSENFVHALSLPFINKRIKNEEENYFQKNKNVKMNIDKYKHYNYHYINNVNYINIYNDLHNNVTSCSTNENNSRRESLTHTSKKGNEALFKMKTDICDHKDAYDSMDDIPYAHSDYELLNCQGKGVREKYIYLSRNLHSSHDFDTDNRDTTSNEDHEGEEYYEEEDEAEDAEDAEEAEEADDAEEAEEADDAEEALELSPLEFRQEKWHLRHNYQIERREKAVPYKIWKIVNLAKHPLIVYSLINHFFLQNNNNIFKIFNYWSYYIFPSTYKYIFFPLTTLQLHPVFKNSDMFILLIHFNLPFILFHLDIFAQKDRDKYVMLNMANGQNQHQTKNPRKHHYNQNHYHVPDERRSTFNIHTTLKCRNMQKEEKHTGRLMYFMNVVNEFTTGVNRHQMHTYIRDSNLDNRVKIQMLQQWRDYRREVRSQMMAREQTKNKVQSKFQNEENKKTYEWAYLSTCCFPFPILSYQNAHEFYKNFLTFYKTVFNGIFHEEKSYIDIFNGFEICKREIYSPLFRKFYLKHGEESHEKKSGHPICQTVHLGKRVNRREIHYRWRFNEDIHQFVNMIITSYNSLSYESIKVLSLEMLYCIIYHLNDSSLNKEIVSFLLFCMNKSNEKIKVHVIKSFYRIIYNENTYQHVYLYLEKFLPSFFLLKDSKEDFEKYFHAKYLPLIANLTLQCIYNVSLLKGKKHNHHRNNRSNDGINDGSKSDSKSDSKSNNKTQGGNEQKEDRKENIKSEAKYMKMLRTLRNQLVHILKHSNDEKIVFEFYEHLTVFCKIMNKKWIKVYILPYLLTNVYKTKNSFIRALSIKVTIQIMLHINEKEMYKLICRYVNQIMFDKNELPIRFLLHECNILTQKNARKCGQNGTVKNNNIEKKKKSHLFIFFLKKIKLNHLHNHSSVTIRNLAKTLQNDLFKMSN